MEGGMGLSLDRDFRRINELIDYLTKTSNSDFPNLLQLQRNLQSPFFDSIRNVYEYVYQQNIKNFGEEASPEILVNAAAKSTVAVFSAAEGAAHPRLIELPKTDQGLGFNVMGGKEQNSPIYISHVIPGNLLLRKEIKNIFLGGVADLHGSLRRGDQLISINGVGSVKLVIRFTPKLLEEIERRFEEQRRRAEHQHSPPFGRSFH
uniref:PDZ domain-containing protein n=1 Tax=Meloidogyne hapla TaxID=6305 RepID=A0A1I8BCZ2_MELHA